MWVERPRVPGSEACSYPEGAEHRCLLHAGATPTPVVAEGQGPHPQEAKAVQNRGTCVTEQTPGQG